MRRVIIGFSLLSALVFVTPSTAGQPEDDEAALKEAGLNTETPALLEYFRKRILPEKDNARVRALVAKLGDERFAVREKTTEELIALGPGIASVLRESVNNRDPEVANRVKECLDIVQKTSTPPLVSAAARLLGHRKPPEAAQVLLAFAPHADGDEAIDAMRAALLSVAMRDGKPDAAMMEAQTNTHEATRGLAVEALIRAKAVTGADAQKHLKDASAVVRLRTATALVDISDKSAVPVLIDALPDVSTNLAWHAEDVLCQMAGEKAPGTAVGETRDSRVAARNAWDQWWKANGAGIDLAALKGKPLFLGLTLVAYQNDQGIGNLMEIGRDNKPRWQFQGLAYPVDLQVLGPDRYLVAEMNASRVSERNRKGEVLWQKAIAQPVACQRLANGNTFIASPQGCWEYDAAGKEVFNHTRNRSDIMGARKHPNGEYILLTRAQIVRIDKTGKEVKAFNHGQAYNYTSMDILPNGNLLVPQHRVNKVTEYTLDGAEKWSGNVMWPTSAQRLPNGNTLVASMNQRKLVELDKDGRPVRDIPIQGNPWVSVRR